MHLAYISKLLLKLLEILRFLPLIFCSHKICTEPVEITNKNGINLQNKDEYSLKYALLSALCPVAYDLNIPSSYKIKDIRDDIFILDNNVVLYFKNLKFTLLTNNNT